METDVLTIISCHTDSDIKINALIHNIKYFLELSSSIVIVNSLEFKNIGLEEKIRNAYTNITINDYLTDEHCYAYKSRYDDLNMMNNNELRNHWILSGKIEKRTLSIPIVNISFDYVANDKFVCHGKWVYYLNKLTYTLFKNIILTNDSFIITRSLFDFKKLIQPNTEMVALLESYEWGFHYPDFLRAYNVIGIIKVLKYYESTKLNIHDFDSVIREYEIKSSHIFDKVDVLYKNSDGHQYNIHFNIIKLKHYLYKENYPIIKIKAFSYRNYYNSIDLPSDFKSMEYKMLNADLVEFSDEQAKTHFLIHGIEEGRFYKKRQKVILPDYLTNYLKLIGFTTTDIFIK
jgi:hypothetical protein